MYISKNQTEKIIRQTEKLNTKVFFIKLEVGKCGLYDLRDIVPLMFKAWKSISNSRRSIFNKSFCGILNRFIIFYDKESGMYVPSFVLLCFVSKGTRIEEYKLKLKTYICWLTAWVKVLKCCRDVNIVWELITLAKLKNFIYYYYGLPIYYPSDNETEIIMKEVIRNHKLYSFSGVFKNLFDIEISRY